MRKISNKARKFDKIAREIFAPAYPAIAQQILSKTQIRQGLCLDIGCGSGYLGLSVAEKSDLIVYAMDSDPLALEILEENIRKLKLERKVKPLTGDVHNIPLESNTIQLAISRGSMFSWEKPIKALNEIYRVMAPNGMAYIGGGFGTAAIKEQIDKEMLKINPQWLEKQKRNIGPEQAAKWQNVLAETDIAEFDLIHNPVEMWLVFQKPTN